jgi:hypothetical protein
VSRELRFNPLRYSILLVLLEQYDYISSYVYHTPRNRK